MSRFSRLKSGVGKRWERVRRLWLILMLIRFSLLMGLVTSIVYLFVPQGQEILIDLTEIKNFSGNLLKKVCFVLAAICCSLSAWYCARVMYRFKFDERIAGRSFAAVKKHLPRWLGASVQIMVGIALLITGKGNIILGIILLVTAAAFLFFVYQRRRIFAFMGLVRFEEEQGDLESLTGLGLWSKIYFVAAWISYFAALILFAHNPGHMVLAPEIGPGAIVLLSFCLLIPIGTAIVYCGERYGVPLIWFCIVAAVIFSLFNDNHRVRQHAAMRSYESQSEKAVAREVSLKQYYTNWLEELEKSYPGEEIPIYMVAAEGGGIRAAYWTAIVLGALADADERFSRHLFAISGVSGGSLGGAVFTGLTGSTITRSGAFQQRAQEILGEDFLSPTLAVLLFPDLLQRFLPVALLDDRAMALEQTWEEAWDRYEKKEDGEKGFFSGQFGSMWSENSPPAPLLFLNSTVVESGNRIIVTPLKFNDFDGIFSDALSAAAVIGTEMPVSTAVHMSARFTYVSPAGTINRRDRPGAWIRVVDGGYFENSGAVTANELLHFIMRIGAERGSRVKPVVIHISNEPVSAGNETGGSDPAGGEQTLMGEVVSPLWALLHARPARGFQAREQLSSEVSEYRVSSSTDAKEAATAGLHHHFRLRENPGVTLPLGWMLSRKAQTEMQEQLAGEENSKRISELLAPLLVLPEKKEN